MIIDSIQLLSYSIKPIESLVTFRNTIDVNKIDYYMPTTLLSIVITKIAICIQFT